MTNEERKRFWDTLNELHDDSQESLDKLKAVYKPPEKLCRFRAVNQNTLQQLQDNKLFFSSADRYDDPFDTYFYINYAKIRSGINSLKNMMDTDTPQHIAAILETNGLQYLGRDFLIPMIESLKKTSPNLLEMEQKLSEVKRLVQQQLFSICFCDDPLNETLWLKYANNHRGFVLIYDMFDPDVFQCGKEVYCEKCFMNQIKPNVYPIYYSNTKYDATRYAVSVQAANILPPLVKEKLSDFINLKWEIEKIALIKKKCHEYDQEWRMLCPVVSPNRPSIKMKPSSIALGLRMPEYERQLVISASKVAGITSINEIVIDDMDELQMKPIVGGSK